MKIINWMEVTESEIEVCRTHSAGFVPISPDSKMAVNIDRYSMPILINGFRHPFTPGFSGWYIYTSERNSEEIADFDVRFCYDVPDELDSIISLLGLAPGWRFLVSGAHIDVWFDENLLNL